MILTIVCKYEYIDLPTSNKLITWSKILFLNILSYSEVNLL